MSYSESKWFPLKLNWPLTQKLLNQPLVFDYKHQQLDNFALMMGGLCQDSKLIVSRVSTLLTALFEIHNRLYCSSEETTKTISPDDLTKSEQLVLVIDNEKTEQDTEALKVCSEAVAMSSSDTLWKYLTAIFHGLKAESYFMVNQTYEGNKARMEMLKLIHQYELFDTLDLVDMIMDHCSQLLTVLWNDTEAEVVTQIDHLLLVARYFLDNAKLDDDFDGLKYQELRKYWHLIVGVNEGRFIEKSWQEFEKNQGSETEKSDQKSLECVKFVIALPDPPKILAHTSMTSPEEFLDRKMTLENHQSNMLQWSPFRVNAEHDSVSLMEELANYAQCAHETIKTHNN